MNKVKIFCLSVMTLAATMGVQAGKISSQTALDRALQSETFCSDLHRPNSISSKSDYILTYSAPSGSYHVFSRNSGGYVIVSGDDEIYPILAEIPEGTFSADSMAPAAKWLLGEYDAQIQSFTDSGGSNEGLIDYYAKWSDIDPLMSTQWNQYAPYNNYCPAINGQSCVTGCVATAMAQVVRCIGYYDGRGYLSRNDVNYKGDKVEFDYEATKFDFDIMFDTYPSSTSAEAVDQVGLLMLACGLGTGMNYGLTESGAPSKNVARALIEHFGYDADYTRIYYRNDFTVTQWETMVYRQLQLGRPVYYAGYHSTIGHAFVIDGYRRTGLYHVNWGWGGLSDGFYRLNALAPSQVGAGGSAGGFNSLQEMVYAVPPGADPGIIYGSMCGYISAVSDGVFALKYRSNRVNNMNVSLGAAIVDANDKTIATATFWSGQNLTASTTLRHDSYSYDFSVFELSPGSYRIYPAYCPDGGEYTITDPITGYQHYVDMTVNENGDYLFSNPPVIAATSDIHVVDIVPGYELQTGNSGMFSLYAVNNGDLDYEGSLKIAILDNDGSELCRFDSQKAVIIANGNSIVDCPFPVFDVSDGLIQAGTYPLRIFDNDSNLLSDGKFSIEVKSISSSWSPHDIEVTNVSSMPSVFISGEQWPHIPLIKTSKTHRSMNLELAFYRPSGTSATNTFTCYEGTIGPMESEFPISPVTINMPAGKYEVCYRKGYNQISRRRPIRIGVSLDNLKFLPDDNGGFAVTMMQAYDDSDEIIIPSNITADGITYAVTSIEPEAFMSQASMSVVDIPSSIEKIGVNAFFICPSLNHIIIRAENPPFTYLNYIAPGLDRNVGFYVPASAYDKYKTLLDPRNRVYTIVETIESRDESLSNSEEEVSLSVYPAHEAIDPAFVIAPVDEASAEIAEVTVSSVASGKLNLNIRSLKKGVATFHIRPAHRSDNYAVLTVTVPEVSTIDNVMSDSDTTPQAVYDLLGRPLPADDGKTSRGVRIIRNSDGKSVKMLQ